MRATDLAHLCLAATCSEGKSWTLNPGSSHIVIRRRAFHLKLVGADGKTVSNVSLFDQGIIQVLQAAITGLSPGQPYTLALATDPSGKGELQPLANFMTNPAGGAIVNTTGPIRQIVDSHAVASPRFLVVAPLTAGKPGTPVQIQQ